MGNRTPGGVCTGAATFPSGHFLGLWEGVDVNDGRIRSLYDRKAPSHLRFGLVLAGALLLHVLSMHALPELAISPVPGFGVTFFSVVLVVMAASATAPSLHGAAWLVLLATMGVLAGIGALREALPLPVISLLVAGTLLGGGSLLGSSIGNRVEHPSHLLVAAYVASIADLLSVLTAGGVSAQILQNESLLTLLAVSWGIVGYAQPRPVIGVGDIVMTAFLIAGARRHSLSLSRTIGALGLGYVVVFAALLASGKPVPALPILGLAFVAANRETLRVRPQEWLTVAIAFAAGIAVMAYFLL